ncbi:MAG: hypothetical protein U1F59_07625 [Candidatus Competibacteraceae bacterium]
MSAESVVLEEVLRRALDDALDIARKEVRSEREEGELFAYFSLLDWAKQQADVLDVRFADQELQAFDPYQLLTAPTTRRAA